MKIMESAENYLETILILKNKSGSVRSIDIVAETARAVFHSYRQVNAGSCRTIECPA